MSLTHRVNRHDTRSASVRDYEFWRATVDQLRQAGLGDGAHRVHHADWGRATEHHEGLRVFDRTR